MFVRVVRFNGVTGDRMDELKARIEESDGPPPEIPIKALQVLYDSDKGTALVLQHFATARDLEDGAQAFDAMDTDETPGTRESVDVYEVAVDVSA